MEVRIAPRDRGMVGLRPQWGMSVRFVTTPLDSNFLVPNGTLVVFLALLVVVGVVVGVLVWLVARHRGAASER
jgi:hypothetical protein